jgi:hypothetical protein
VSEQGADLSHSGWAYLCAGGSMPNLPRTTDANLLAAIPRMKPWIVDGGKKIWALGEENKQLLIYSQNGAELDDSGGLVAFRLNAVDSHTGKVTAGSQVVQSGGKLKLPGGIVWLTQE